MEKMSNYIIGLNIGNHDSSAALIKDGKLLSYIEQERFSRNKMAIGEAPIDALKYCLALEGIGLPNVEAIAIGMDWPYRNRIYNEPDFEKKKYLSINNIDRYLPKCIFGDYRPPVYYIRHHIAHAASAYRLSGFDKCAVLVIDNRGEDASCSLGIAENGDINFFKTIGIGNSLGLFYNRACEFTGLYGKYREVGKFMGLASYGIPNIEMPLEPARDGELFRKLQDIGNATIYETIKLRKKQLVEYFNEKCFPFEAGNVDEIMSYANFAASVQKALEDVILDFIYELKEKTALDNLVVAGGVALNCSANAKIEQSGLFRHIYIPPFVSDAGTSIGAALELSKSLHNHRCYVAPLHIASLGASYSDTDVLKVLEKSSCGLAWEIVDDDRLYDSVSAQIELGKIIAWMQGKFEAGPRALGNRSILADPRTRKSLIRLNRIKEREMWRPIAPSVLEEDYINYFTGYADNKYFMNVAAYVKEDVQKLIPAVVHVDKTARPQVVTRENLSFYRLIESFKKQTGIGVLCNTSFNLRGKPLVNKPEDAIECFIHTEIDLLVIGNIIIRKL